MTKLEQIIDLHAHLFNARYLPLASIIAHAMDRDEDPLASALAWLLELLTESSYKAPATRRPLRLPAQVDSYYVEQICDVVEFELRVAAGSARAAKGRRMTTRQLERVQNSELMEALRNLARARHTPSDTHVAGIIPFTSFASLAKWARTTVRASLHAAVAQMDKSAWGETGNYVEFFFNMLSAEERMVKRLKDGYGTGLPPMRVVHHMMDMQMAYAGHKEPYYLFYPTQLRRMQVLQRNHRGAILGFTAFDPRRPDWRDHAQEALRKGFVGFKFYPAMEYKPIGNKDPAIETRVREFFAFCIANNAPVFTHCTTQGFQTRCKHGLYAHPRLWGELLSEPGMEKLRLCLGHAGGGDGSNTDPDDGHIVHSYGWMATTQAEWDDAGNFARIVVELCCNYENVYCELAYITELLEPSAGSRRALRCLTDNLARAVSGTAGSPHAFLDKLAYGSDWHMPSMIDNTRRYLDIFLGLRDQGILDDRFFWKNACRYLDVT